MGYSSTFLTKHISEFFYRKYNLKVHLSDEMLTEDPYFSGIMARFENDTTSMIVKIEKNRNPENLDNTLEIINKLELNLKREYPEFFL